jgi:hypothetical protein
MHGCEYHIFTLLETLRHRVRQGQDTVLVFLDFKKAYDSVSQPLAWEVLKRMGIPDDFISLLTSWTSQSRIVSPGARRPSGRRSLACHLQSLH